MNICSIISQPHLFLLYVKLQLQPEPMSRAGFASPVSTHRAASAAASLVDPANTLLEMSRKRKAEPNPFDEVHSPSKRQNSREDPDVPMQHEEV